MLFGCGGTGRSGAGPSSGACIHASAELDDSAPRSQAPCRRWDHTSCNSTNRSRTAVSVSPRCFSSVLHRRGRLAPGRRASSPATRVRPGAQCDQASNQHGVTPMLERLGDVLVARCRWRPAHAAPPMPARQASKRSTHVATRRDVAMPRPRVSWKCARKPMPASSKRARTGASPAGAA